MSYQCLNLALLSLESLVDMMLLLSLRLQPDENVEELEDALSFPFHNLSHALMVSLSNS